MLNNKIHDDEFQSLCTMLQQKTKFFFLLFLVNVNKYVCMYGCVAVSQCVENRVYYIYTDTSIE